jgi:hypothetical protein
MRLSAQTARHESQVDLAFVVDSTTSMSPYIVEAQSQIKKIVRRVSRRTACNVRFALVSYRDHRPQDTTYVSRFDDFTNNFYEMQGV